VVAEKMKEKTRERRRGVGKAFGILEEKEEGRRANREVRKLNVAQAFH